MMAAAHSPYAAAFTRYVPRTYNSGLRVPLLARRPALQAQAYLSRSNLPRPHLLPKSLTCSLLEPLRYQPNLLCNLTCAARALPALPALRA